ncbi:hypothetical protein KSP39_PZI015071 [Platanthera zijinensis]|uniref:AIG1-type G domain-containing protein n=1 Tax=Platanthera zijinensis TaxID=2320716 RepID=A0AAP0BBY6_9ASPA
MENGVEIVGGRPADAEHWAENGSEGFADSHFTNGGLNDSGENEIFEDTVTGAERVYTPQHLNLFVNFDGGMGSEGSNGDLGSVGNGSAGIRVNDQFPENEELVFREGVDSIANSHTNDTISEQIETARANKDNNGGDVLELNGDTANGEEMRENNWNGGESGGALVETYSVQGNGREIVSESDDDNLGSENPANGVAGDEAAFYKSCVEEFESEEDILSKREVEEMRSERIDEIREDDGARNMADSLLMEDGSVYFDVASENEEHLKQGVGSIPESKSAVKEGTPADSVLVEEISKLSSAEDGDDDENNNFSHGAPSSNSRPEPSDAPSLSTRPAGLGTSVPLLESTSRSFQLSRANVSVPHQRTMISEDLVTDVMEESDEIREKLQMIRVKFVRVAYRLGQTPHNEVVAQVLYRLGLAEQVTRRTNSQGVFGFDRASVMAKQLEAGGKEPLNFTCTIMVIGKTGVGKSATINSIFDDAELHTNAFQLCTKRIQNVVGTVQGIKVRVIDTPGLSSCPSDQRRNEKILNSMKSFISKTPPDVVLYFDRLDIRSRDYGDVPLLRTITDVFGSSIWFNAIVVLTHACAAPPDGPNGTPLSYEMFVTQRSHVVQQAIRQAAGDAVLMNPVSLVENHSACRMNRAGQRVLPNGLVWKPQLLLLSFASKILHEANMLLKLDDSPPGRPFTLHTRSPPLPFLLSSLLQSKPHLKLPEEQMDDEDNMFEGGEETSDADDASDYDELPPFKYLGRSELAKLSKVQRRAYYDELDYREKLFFKKQLREEKKHRKLLKKMSESVPDVSIDHNGKNVEDESGVPASIPVPMPDVALPNSFDSDYPTHRYRFLDSSSSWVVKPVLETQGWDHDVGYEGLNVERLFVVRNKIPLSISGQLTKDKKDCSLQLEVASLVKHNERTASSVCFDLQTVGKDMAYTLRGETMSNFFWRNAPAAGLSVTVLGDSISAGAKFEDKLMLSKRFSVLISGGAMTSRGDVAYGGRLESVLKDKEYPLGRSLSTIALSFVDWHGDLAVGCNIQSQHPLGRGTNAICHGNFSNKGSGQVGIRLNTSDHLQMALIALLPIFRNAIRLLFASSESP